MTSPESLAFLWQWPTTALTPITLMLTIFAVGWALAFFERGFFSFIAFIGFMYLLMGGSEVAIVALGGSFLGGVLLLASILFILYGAGDCVHKAHYTAFTFQMLAFFAVLVLVMTKSFQFSPTVGTLLAIGVFLAYMVAGGFVSFRWQWPKFNRELQERILDSQVRFLQRLCEQTDEDLVEMNLSREDILKFKAMSTQDLRAVVVPEHLVPYWRRATYQDLRIPDKMDAIGMLLRWTVGWPGIAIHYFLHDLVEQAVTWIVNHFGGLLTRLQDMVFKDHPELLRYFRDQK